MFFFFFVFFSLLLWISLGIPSALEADGQTQVIDTLQCKQADMPEMLILHCIIPVTSTV